MLCNLCTRSSSRAIASAAVRANRRISSASVGPVRMSCCRQGQNHISVFPPFVSKLTFPSAKHCITNAGSTHILVALRHGWGKDCCCYVHLALLPTGLDIRTLYHGFGHKKRMYRSSRLRSCLKTNVATSSDVCMKHI